MFHSYASWPEGILQETCQTPSDGKMDLQSTKALELSRAPCRQLTVLAPCVMAKSQQARLFLVDEYTEYMLVLQMLHIPSYAHCYPFMAQELSM